MADSGRASVARFKAYRTVEATTLRSDDRMECSTCCVLRVWGDRTVHKSILDAIRDGEWDYEPEQVAETRFNPTGAMPGTREKLSVLADRVKAGLPLWHGCDRTEYEDEN